MFHEDVKMGAKETLSDLASAYGHPSGAWLKLWADPKNLALVVLRKQPEHLQAGDVVHIPIPWKIVSKRLDQMTTAARVVMKAQRDGLPGSRLHWAQTVYRHNQPINGTAVYVVDAPDDDEPFYYTQAELQGSPHSRKEFFDAPYRGPPPEALGTTTWRAVLSIAVRTGKRVTVYDSVVWGFDRAPDGGLFKYPPRPATAYERSGHLQLLKSGMGKTGTFKSSGWTFRTA